MSGGMKLIFHLLCVWGRSPWGQSPLGTPQGLVEGFVWVQIPARNGQREDLCDCIPCRGQAGSRWDQRGQSRSVPLAAARSSPNICSAHSPSRPSHMALPPGSVAQVPGARPCSSTAVCPSATTPPPRRCPTGCRKPRQGAWEHSMPSGACAPPQTAGAPGIWVGGRGGGTASLTCLCRVLVALHCALCHHVKIGKD